MLDNTFISDMGIAVGIPGSLAGRSAGSFNPEGFITAHYGSASKYDLPFSSIITALCHSAELAGMIPAGKAAKT